MLNGQNPAYSALPPEYRGAAEALFPDSAVPGGLKEPALLAAPLPTVILPAAAAFSEALGIGADYRKALDFCALNGDSGELKKFLHSFQNNLELLIQKTWIEKTDEDRKEKLLARVPSLAALVKNGDYPAAFRELSGVLEELAWLLFGAQSHKEDFIDYTLRIDTQMGLFWWYAGQTSRLCRELEDRESIRLVLLLGLCYLTGF